jgi:hypothetical protein
MIYYIICFTILVIGCNTSTATISTPTFFCSSNAGRVGRQCYGNIDNYQCKQTNCYESSTAWCATRLTITSLRVCARGDLECILENFVPDHIAPRITLCMATQAECETMRETIGGAWEPSIRCFYTRRNEVDSL